MSERLKGKVALVTGASSGIGEAAAKGLARQGASVVLVARRADELERVAKEIEAEGGEAVPVIADVTRDEDVAASVRVAEERFGGLDVAFNNAGALGSVGAAADQDPEVWLADVTAVLGSVFRSVRHEIPVMVERGGGVIVNNASHLGLIGVGLGISSYVAAKHGVVGLTKAVALEYAERNVRVNALALASVDTDMYRSSVGGDPDAAEFFRSMHPLGRIATAEEAASAVVYLAGDEAGFFTGSALVMDGGWTAR